MHAYLEIIDQLVAKIDGKTWLKQPSFPFSFLKSPKSQVFDVCLFDVDASGAWGILILAFEGTEKLFVYPFRLSRYAQESSLISITPWSLKEASFDADFYEAWRDAQKRKNPIATRNSGLCLFQKSTGDVGFVTSEIWRDPSSICVRLDFQMAYKLFKVLDPHQPLSPEVEILEYLNTQKKFHSYSKIVNSYMYLDPLGKRYHLGIGMRYLQNEGTLFASTVHIQYQLTQDPPASWDLQKILYEKHSTHVQNLGKLIADFHVAMASTPREHPLAPKPHKEPFVNRWKTFFLQNTREKMDLFLNLNQFGNKASSLLKKANTTYNKYINHINKIENYGTFIRIHGDIHIGQILVLSEGLGLLDFDSDFQNSLGEEHQKHFQGNHKQEALPDFHDTREAFFDRTPCLMELATIIASFYFSWLYTEAKVANNEASKYTPSLCKHPARKIVEKSPEIQSFGLKQTIQIFLKSYLSALRETPENTHLLPAYSKDFPTLLNIFIFFRIIHEAVRSDSRSDGNLPIWLSVLELFLAKPYSLDFMD